MRRNRPLGRNKGSVDNMRAFITKKQVRAPLTGSSAFVKSTLVR